ncbi:MAG: hypothetical protein AB1806_11635, partial [Acidobacteriota bacterium]
VPTPDIRPVLGEAIGASDRPLTVAAALKAVKQVHPRAKRSAVETALDELTASGDIHRHPPARTGGAPLFHRHPARDYAASRVRQAISGDARLTPTALRRAVGKAYQPFFDEVLAELVAAGHVRPTRFLTARQVSQLTSITGTMNTLRSTPLALASVLALFDGAPATVAPAVLDQSLSEAQLVQWYAEDLPSLGGLRSVPIPWTWRHYEAWSAARSCRPSLDLFHRHLLAMASRAAVGLTPHDHEGRLPDDEKHVLPLTPAGYRAYYWTILR